MNADPSQNLVRDIIFFCFLAELCPADCVGLCFDRLGPEIWEKRLSLPFMT